MEKHTIVGVHITNRIKHVQVVQKIFTEFGCEIKTRLGLHDVGSDACSPNGLILLEVCGPDTEIAKMMAKLKKVTGVDVKKMIFTHP
jgi:hypothetical protein